MQTIQYNISIAGCNTPLDFTLYTREDIGLAPKEDTGFWSGQVFKGDIKQVITDMVQTDKIPIDCIVSAIEVTGPDDKVIGHRIHLQFYSLSDPW
jgi:hypothetical protein